MARKDPCEKCKWYRYASVYLCGATRSRLQICARRALARAEKIVIEYNCDICKFSAVCRDRTCPAYSIHKRLSQRSAK